MKKHRSHLCHWITLFLLPTAAQSFFETAGTSVLCNDNDCNNRIEDGRMISSNTRTAFSREDEEEQIHQRLMKQVTTIISGNELAYNTSADINSTSTISFTNETMYLNETTDFDYFTAHDGNMTCTADEHHYRPFNNQIRGVNLGGWLVLEPWITPSMFYQFLNQGVNTTAFDMYTFCEVLGPVEANKQLRRHWDNWVTQDIIQKLAATNAVNSLRLPVGDFYFIPYGPYSDGCIDGGLEYIDLVLDWAYSHGLTVLIDIHTMKDSQNGFDNSGQAMGFEWTSALSSEFAGLTTFEHWPIRTANWMGTFDTNKVEYTNINYENLEHGLRVIELIVKRYATHPAVLGIEPVNEPWQYTPLDELKRFYWEGYKIVKTHAPYWKYIMHDSFRFEPGVWGGFMDGCPERALDTHLYQAWREPDSRVGYFNNACQAKSWIASMELAFGPVVVGEWSLATDNCAMWLNGFNDNLPGFPRLPCKYAPCIGGPYYNETPYMGVDEQPGVPIDPSKPMQGPYGTGMSGPIFGLCPCSRDWLKESNGNPLTGQDWIRAPPKAPPNRDDTDFVMQRLALKKIDAFSGIGHGFFFWNFRTDLYEPQWSYMAALERGWIPNGNLNDEKIRNACIREDKGDFKCILKRGQIDKTIKRAVTDILNAEGMFNSTEGQEILNMTGPELETAAGTLITEFFDRNRYKGATCDFGGICMLVESNRNITNEDPLIYSADEYTTIIIRGPPLWMLFLAGSVIAMIAGMAGFVIAMRRSPGFNQRIRSNPLFLPITKSHNSLLRSSLNLPQLDDYDEIFTNLNGKANGMYANNLNASKGPLSF